MKKYMGRIVDTILKDKLEAKGAVLIEGPKWCGKTTTGKNAAASVLKLDESRDEYIAISEISPRQLLQGDTPRLLDEWQLAPNLWDAVRYEVDERGLQGQFILTVSAVPIESDKMSHSGTGRFSWLSMRTMSLFESGESNGSVSLERLFLGDGDVEGENTLDIEQLSFFICRGGWPQAVGMKKKAALEQAFDYYEGVVRSDVNRAGHNEKNVERVKRIMRSYARNQGQQVAYTMLKSDIEINETETLNEDTVAAYVNVLKDIFVVEDMPAWNPNLRSKSAIRSSDTRYFTDPSIAVAALGIGPDDLTKDIKTLGFFFEALCVRDLRVYAESLNGNVYHYRDNTGLECDAVIHLRNGKYALVEIKLGGERLIEEGAANLKKLCERIDTKKMGAPTFQMILVGVGSYAYQRKDGIYIVPIGCLRN